MAYSESDIENLVKTVTNNQDGLEFIYYLLEEFGTFHTRINLGASELQNICRQVKREQGEFILDLVRKYNFKKFIELEKKRSNESCQKTLS